MKDPSCSNNPDNLSWSKGTASSSRALVAAEVVDVALALVDGASVASE